jgi:3'-phosphoadenosine 5'-phosphosulfate sulfotransferase (PAPS reductase)/FAD synthetase
MLAEWSESLTALKRIAGYGAILGFLVVSSGCVIAPEQNDDRDHHHDRDRERGRDHEEHRCGEHEHDHDDRCRERFQ